MRTLWPADGTVPPLQFAAPLHDTPSPLPIQNFEQTTSRAVRLVTQPSALLATSA